MVSPMRERRAWPPREKDADAEAVAAFEKTVAVVKETVVRSGEVLVSAKEDLNDHQRWLKAQTAQVQADRQRHDRWLQRQREQQEAHERREQKRARRRQMRQAVVQAVTGAIAACVFAVRSAIWSVVARTIAGLNYIDASAARGLRFIGGRLRAAALHVAEAVWRIIAFAGGTARSLALSAWAFLVASLASLGRVFIAALVSLGGLIGAGASRVSAKLHAIAPSLGHVLSVSFGGIAARARDALRGIAAWLGAGVRMAWRQGKRFDASDRRRGRFRFERRRSQSSQRRAHPIGDRSQGRPCHWGLRQAGSLAGARISAVQCRFTRDLSG